MFIYLMFAYGCKKILLTHFFGQKYGLKRKTIFDNKL